MTNFHLETFGLTDVGLVRKKNEDAFAEMPHLHFFTVADGMGGHTAGDVAAHLAVDALCQLMKVCLMEDAAPFSLEEMKAVLVQAFESVNESVLLFGQNEWRYRGMGTTLSALYFHPKGAIIAHVGDSRIYCFRRGELVQLTEDHSLLKKLTGRSSPIDAQGEEGRYRNILTRAIGIDAAVDPDVESVSFEVGDIYLMCTDGLTDRLSNSEIATIIKEYLPSVGGIAEELLEEAIRKGGQDNITVLLIKVVEDASKDLP